jgi:hypothetical protein
LSLGGSFACSLFGNLFDPQDPETSKPITEFNAALEVSDRDLHVLIRDDPEAAAQAALEQLDADDPAARFAALYALANTAATDEQLEGLRATLASASLSERVLAAEALLVRGEKQALPVLIEALGSDEDLAFSLPPRQAWEYARDLLLTYTEGDFGLTADESFAAASAARPAWQAWWQANGGGIEWRPDEGVYR